MSGADPLKMQCSLLVAGSEMFELKAIDLADKTKYDVLMYLCKQRGLCCRPNDKN
jgi:hypothetical protein